MKDLIIKFTIFFITIVVLQIVITLFAQNKNEIKAFEKLTELELKLEKPVDFLYFGDSTLTEFYEDDADRRSIPEMLSKLVGRNVTVEIMQHDAYHLGVYEAYSHYLEDRMRTIPNLIVPINIRSFGYYWSKTPHYQFKKEIRILKSANFSFFYRAFNRVLRVFKYDMSNISQNSDMVNWLKQSTWEKRGQSEKNTKHCRTSYIEDIPTFHIHYKSLTEMITRFSRLKKDVIFYFPPIDYQECSKHFPDKLKMKIRSKIKKIKEILDSQKVAYIDMTFELGTEHFHYRSQVNEHLKQSGRLYVAKRLSDFLIEKKFVKSLNP